MLTKVHFTIITPLTTDQPPPPLSVLSLSLSLSSKCSPSFLRSFFSTSLLFSILIPSDPLHLFQDPVDTLSVYNAYIYM